MLLAFRVPGKKLRLCGRPPRSQEVTALLGRTEGGKTRGARQGSAGIPLKREGNAAAAERSAGALQAVLCPLVWLEATFLGSGWLVSFCLFGFVGRLVLGR